MKQIKWAIFITILVLIIPGLAKSQGLDLEGYLSILKENNLIIKQSINQRQSSLEDIRSARASLLPSAGIESSYQRDFTKNFLFINDPDFGLSKFRTNFNNSINVNFVAQQSIYDPAAMAQVKIAKLASSLSDLSLQQSTQELLTQGSQLFWQALFLRESLVILKDNRTLAREQWQQMGDLFEQGVVSELALQQSELFYQRTLPVLASAENSFESILNELKFLISLEPTDDLILSGQIALENIEAPIYLEASINKNLNIQVANKELSIAEEQIRASKSARAPVLRANLGYNLNAQDNTFRFKNDNQLWYGLISLEIPLFTGGFNKAQIEKSRINYANANIQMEQLRLNLLKNLKNAELSQLLALQLIESEKKAIFLSEKELEIAEEKARIGILSPLEKKEMRMNLTRAKLNLINAQLDLRIANSEIEQIIGSNNQTKK
ncbi:MAG: outer membrane protein [Roseivirga sp.]